MQKPHELTYQLLNELGITNPDEALAEKIEDHFSKVILEVFMRRVPEERLGEIKEKIDRDDPEIDVFIAQLASQVPGLAVEIEEAVMREYEVIKTMLKK